MPPTPPPPDLYLMGFLLFGLPILLLMVGIGVVAIRKRWKSAAYICGAVFLLTAGSMYRDALHRPLPSDELIVKAIGFACGVAGLLLIILARRFRPVFAQPDQGVLASRLATTSPTLETPDSGESGPGMSETRPQ